MYERFDLNPEDVMAAVQKVVASEEALKQIASNFKA